ncbi:MAG: glycosyltransferase family 39 protein [Bacteroidetes bacterium]|nr:glycosyltransferase family 39 protein [Bacteroidota bacterium]
MSKQNIIQTSSDKQGSKSLIQKLTKEEKVSYTILLGLIFLVVLIRSKFLLIPFERDEGAYSYYGKLLLQGGIPYKDFYEQKFPGIFYFYAFIVGIFGETVKGMHIGFTILNILTIIFLFFASKRMFSPLAGAITAISYAIVSLTPNLSGFTVQSEHGVAFFTSLGIFFYSFVVKKSDWKYLLLMGIALGCAFMVKTTGIFLVFWGGGVIVTDFLCEKKPKVIKEFFRRTFIYSIGVLLIIGIFFLIVGIKGAYKEMIYWSIEVPKQYVSTIKWEDGKKYLEYTYDTITKEYKLFWVHAFFALIIVFLRGISSRIKFMSVSLLFFSVLTIFPGYYFYGHYWIQILPGLAIGSGITFYIVNEFIKNTMGFKSEKVKYIYISIFIILFLMHLNKLKDYYFNPNYDRILRTVYGNNPFPETAKIADYINANSSAEDNIVAIGSEPQLYFYTKKRCPSRHAYFTALVFGSQHHAQWQREFVKDVEKANPRYVIFYNHPISLMVQPNADKYLFEWFNKFITEGYKVIGIVDMVEGYMLSTYVWHEQLETYKPQGPNIIYIYERIKSK